MNKINVKIRKLHPHAITPAYATELAAGFDLVAVEDVIIAPGETALVPIGLAFEIPPDFEMQIRPRSGVSYRTKLRVANSPGTIDADYRDGVKVLIDNNARAEYGSTPRLRNLEGRTEFYDGQYFDKYTYIIRKGERFAQAVIAPIVRVGFEVVDELTETERGAGGFGSTGVTTEEAAAKFRKAFEALPSMADLLGK